MEGNMESPWFQGAASVDEWMQRNKTVVAATTASLVSTFAGFPLDSLKSRLQSTGDSVGISRLAADVIREEGVRGLWRGSPLPLVSIAVVRTISFTIYTNTKYLINGPPALSSPGTAVTSLQAPSNEQLDFRDTRPPPTEPFTLNILKAPSVLNVGLTSALAGGASGAVVSIGSCPFELVKVRRQLEFQIARERGLVPRHPPTGATVAAAHAAGNTAGTTPHDAPAMSEEVRKALLESEARDAAGGKPRPIEPYKPPGTWEAVKQIQRERGAWGLWTGFKLHAVRDTLGTALYFMEYDVFRYLLGRVNAPPTMGADGVLRQGRGGFGSEVQGPLPDWAKGWMPVDMVPFVCGSLAGVTSWAIIYPVDAIKTKTQQRMLSGLPARSPIKQLNRLVRGTDPANPKPLLQGMSRLYRGLGISMVRSMMTHGLLWTIVDATSRWIDTKPFEAAFTEA